MKQTNGTGGDVDYASGRFMYTTPQALLCLSEEENILRSYYRMQHNLDSCTEAEKKRRQGQYDAVFSRYFGAQSEQPYQLLEPAGYPTGAVNVRNRSRYFPTVDYRSENFEFFYVQAGQCHLTSHGMEYELQSGDFCLLQYGAPHRIENNSDDCILLEIQVEKAHVQRICSLLLSEDSILSHYFKNSLYGTANYPIIIFRTKHDAGVTYYVYAMYNECQIRPRYWNIMVVSLLNALFAYLLSIFRPEQVIPDFSGDSFASAVIQYIAEHEAQVNLESLAAAFGYSASHMGELVIQHCGKPFTALLRQMHMHRAARLLKETDLPISQIAAEVCCTDAPHFNRSFRREFSMLPAEYRQLFSGSTAE